MAITVPKATISLQVITSIPCDTNIPRILVSSSWSPYMLLPVHPKSLSCPLQGFGRCTGQCSFIRRQSWELSIHPRRKLGQSDNMHPVLDEIWNLPSSSLLSNKGWYTESNYVFSLLFYQIKWPPLSYKQNSKREYNSSNSQVLKCILYLFLNKRHLIQNVSF